MKKLMMVVVAALMGAAWAGPDVMAFWPEGRDARDAVARAQKVLATLADEGECYVIASATNAASCRATLARLKSRCVVVCADGGAVLREVLAAPEGAKLVALKVNKVVSTAALPELRVPVEVVEGGPAFAAFAAVRPRRVGRFPASVIDSVLDELAARTPRRLRPDVIENARTRCEKTATGVRLARDGKTIWNFEIDTPEGRPFLHPMYLPSGAPLTDVRPADHVWHLGCWFSWKFINGVNYWEPADAKRKGCEPEGRTRVVKKSISCEGAACTVELALDYGPRAGKDAVLDETRTVTFDPPDPKGGYIVTFRHRFTARAGVTLDRTPPPPPRRRSACAASRAAPPPPP